MTRYQAADIETKLGLGGDQILLYSLLAGGDYDPGVSGCGQSYALKLAMSPISQSMRDKLMDSSESSQATLQSLGTWRTNARAALHNEGTLLTVPHRAKKLLEDALNNSFPNPDIVHLYTHPATSLNGPHHQSLHPHVWSHAVAYPCLADLFNFCKRVLGWTDETLLLSTLEHNVWDGVILRLLYSVSW